MIPAKFVEQPRNLKLEALSFDGRRGARHDHIAERVAVVQLAPRDHDGTSQPGSLARFLCLGDIQLIERTAYPLACLDRFLQSIFRDITTFARPRHTVILL
jgi:hypothetical protein